MRLALYIAPFWLWNDIGIFNLNTFFVLPVFDIMDIMHKMLHWRDNCIRVQSSVNDVTMMMQWWWLKRSGIVRPISVLLSAISRWPTADKCDLRLPLGPVRGVQLLCAFEIIVKCMKSDRRFFREWYWKDCHYIGATQIWHPQVGPKSKPLYLNINNSH